MTTYIVVLRLRSLDLLGKSGNLCVIVGDGIVGVLRDLVAFGLPGLLCGVESLLRVVLQHTMRMRPKLGKDYLRYADSQWSEQMKGRSVLSRSPRERPSWQH